MRKRRLFLTLVVISLISFKTFSQHMHIQFIPTDELKDDSIHVEIGIIYVDTSVLVIKNKLDYHDLSVTVPLDMQACTSGVPLEYYVSTSQHEFEYFRQFIGTCDTVTIDLNNGSIAFPLDHIMHKLYKWESEYRGDPAIGDSIDHLIFEFIKVGLLQECDGVGYLQFYSAWIF